MAGTAFAIPILPGKTEDWREFYGEVQGVHLHLYEESRREAGITREVVQLQRTAFGDIAIIQMEADDPRQSFEIIATSNRPFDRWFREWILELHGLDLTHPSQPEDIFAWHAS